jgi:putative DNA primase/helicase
MFALRGRPRGLFPAPEAVPDDGGFLWLVEGEPDVVRAHSLGLPSVSVPGVNCWKAGWRERFRGRRVVVCFDSDDAGRQAAARIASDLVGVAAEVRVLDLDPEADDGTDLTDFARGARTAEEREQLHRLLVQRAEAAPLVAADAQPEAEQQAPASTVDLGLDDVGNSARFVEQNADGLRFVPAWGAWLRWDGMRWAEDDILEHRRRAKTTARELAAEAALEPDEQKRKALLVHARRSAAEPRVRAMLALAAADLRLVVRPAELDCDPWVLNTHSGVVDLRTGDLRPHRPQDHLTMLAGAPYDPAATAPCWEAHLRRFLLPELIGFLQRLFGMAAIGVVLEHILAIFYGGGANGKSVTRNAIAGALGDYAHESTLDLLLQTGRSPGRATPELADLRGRRFVHVAESNEDGRLAAERVKWITGGDPITARRLYGNPFSFEPSHTVVLATNHKPRIGDDSRAMWRRVVLVPFNVTLPESEWDPQIGAKLAAERPGILKWIIDGARWYLRDGLDAPPVVREATEAYKRDEDQFGGFLDERTVTEDGASVAASALLKAHSVWAETSGAPSLSANALAEKLVARGFERKRVKQGTRYFGLRLHEEGTLDVRGGSGGSLPNNFPRHTRAHVETFGKGCNRLQPATLRAAS